MESPGGKRGPDGKGGEYTVGLMQEVDLVRVGSGDDALTNFREVIVC